MATTTTETGVLASLVGRTLVHRSADGTVAVAGVVGSGIVMGDEVYSSLSAAARAAAGCRVNGWTYWTLERSDVERDFELEIEAITAAIAALDARIESDAFDRGAVSKRSSRTLTGRVTICPRTRDGRWTSSALWAGRELAEARAELRSLYAERAEVRRELAAYRRPLTELRRALEAA